MRSSQSGESQNSGVLAPEMIGFADRLDVGIEKKEAQELAFSVAPLHYRGLQGTVE